MHSSSPLLCIPRKRTLQIDFTESFSNYIQSHYQESPSTYLPQIQLLNKQRQDSTCGEVNDVVGRDIQYRYHGQLDLLDSRFPINETTVKVLFTWYDAFTGLETCQYSIAFEKACMLFNIASTLSSIASQQNRNDQTGQKMAYNYFQAAAGVFKHINDNFLHPPSVDLSKESINVLVNLCLAQAQECFIEKVLAENKKGNMVAKLCAHSEYLYNCVIEGMQFPAIQTQFHKAWIEIVKIKALYFDCLSHLHKSLYLEQEKKYGDSVAYIKAAHEKSIQLMKLSSSFAKKYAAYATPSIPIKTPLSASLLQICTLLQSQITPLHVKMLKENEIIYHEPIPACMTIEKLSLSNPTDFKTICQPLDPRHIIGSDLFHSLVPMDVHINASVYSDKLSNFTRQIQLECEVSDDLFKATLDSMDVYKVITSIKTSTQTFEFDGAVCAMIENLKRSESSSDSIGESEEKIGSMKNTVQSSFTRIQELILKIKREGSAFALITGNPIETLLLNKMESDFERYEKVYNEGQTTDKSRIESSLGLKRGITLLLEPLKNLERIVESAGQSSDVSLIDIESGISMTEDVLLSKVESLISKLRECKSHRLILLERLKTKVLLTSQ